MQKLYRKVIFLLCIIFVLFTTVVFSALSTSLAITTDVVIRPISDIRVDNVVLSGSTVDGATLQYESEFNMDKITNGFILPNTNSSITYKVTISNNGDYDQTIYNITTNSNINCNYVIKYSNGNTFNYKDIIEKKTSVDLYITYTPITPSNSVINITHNFDFRKVYKIVYQEQGGTSVTDQYKYEKEDLILNSINNVIEKPTKSGYNFLGWTDIENSNVVKFHAGDTLTIDLDENPIYTLYAIYELSEYNITFNPDNGENNIVRTISAGESLGTLPAVSKTGYTLDGWYDTSDNQITSSTIPTKDETYKAKWIANTYTITLDKNGGTNNPTNSITATYDSSDLEPARIILPEKLYTVSNFGLASTRHSDGATVSSTSDLTTNYSFSGWYTESSNGIQLMDNQETPTLLSSINDYTDEESKWIHDEDITLFARFSGSGNIILPTIEKTGYTCGWTANENGTTIQLQSGETITPILSTPLYGVCVPNTYTVTADSNGGTIPSTSGWNGTGNTSTKSVTYDSTYGTLPTPTRTGYTFNGWNGKNLLNLEVNEGEVSDTTTENTTKRIFEPNTYVVGLAFNNYFFDYVSNFNIVNNNSINLTARSGYGIAYPLLSTSGKNYVLSYTSSLISGTDSPNPVSSVMFYSEDGSLISYIRTNGDGNKTVQFTTPANTHYLVIQFGAGGINTNVEFSNIQLEEGTTATAYEPYYVTSSTTVTQSKNHTLTAKWSPKTYAITLNKGASTNTPTSSVTATYNSSSLSPSSITVPTQSYSVSGFGLSSTRKSDGATVSSTSALNATYTFDGWYSESTGGSKVLSNASSPVLQANVSGYTGTNGIWTKDGSTTLYARFTGNGSITLPTITKTGYTCGWTANESGTIIQHESGATINNIIANTILYGVCTPNTYTVTADSNGGTIPSTSGWTGTGNTSTKSVTYDSTYGTLPTPTRTGYTFNGWNGKNLFDEQGILMKIDGAVYSDGYYTFHPKSADAAYGRISSSINSDVGNQSMDITFKQNTQYTLSLKGYTDYIEDASVYQTFLIGFFYTDGTKSVTTLYSNEYEQHLVSEAGKSISRIAMSYGRANEGANVHIKYIQLEEGTTATAYEPYYVTSSTTVTQTKNHTLTAQWTPKTYAITLDNQSATTTGTTSIYEKYNTGYYLNSGATTQMTTSSNGITVPTKTGYIFGGYYTGTNGSGTQYIDSSGKLTSNASTTQFTSNGTLYAKWTRVMAENIGHTNSTLGCSDVQCMIDKLYELLN